MKNNFALIGVVFAVFISIFSSSTFALQMPATFYGSVLVNGSSVNGVSVIPFNADTDMQVVDYKNPIDPQNPPPYGFYALDVSYNENLTKIYFKINGLITNEGNITMSFPSTVELNLTATDIDDDGYSVLDDCNDSNSQIHPGQEYCNGIDDNCKDGIADEVCDFVYYCDADGDGHAGKAVSNTCTTYNCIQNIPSGCSATAGDDCCDAGTESSTGCSNEYKASIHPGVEELCGGIDYNCDGITNGCSSPSPPSGPSGGGGGTSAYCGDGILQKYRGEECELNIACNGTGLTCNLTSCKCVACTESWTCGEWNDCAGGVQTRICTDANTCGTVLKKPSESQTCSGSGSSGTQITNLGAIVCGNGVCDDGETCENCPADCQCADANAQGNQGFNLIGMFMGAPGLSLLGLLALAIIIAILLLATRKKKKKK